jgi:hypothetical protein
LSHANKPVEGVPVTEFDSTFVTLKVTDWFQVISNTGPLDPPGLSMSANVALADEHDLELSTQERLRDLSIGVSFAEGTVLRGDGQPLARGIGRFNYSNGAKGSVGCWFGLDPELYREAWAQVRAGATQCSITLEIAPLQKAGGFPRWDVDKNRSLFVLGASMHFHRAIPSGR